MNRQEPVLPPFVPTAPALIEHVARHFGDHALAVLGDARLTYADAADRSALMAKALLASGVGKGTRVGVLAPNGPDWIIAWLAVVRIGAIATLLNTYHKAAELGHVLRHADVQVLLAADAHLAADHLARLEAAVPDLAAQPNGAIRSTTHPSLRAVWTWGGAPTRPWAGHRDELLVLAADVPDEMFAAAQREVTPADEMMIIHTSGSTSAPKGVVHGHGPTIRHAYNLATLRALAPDDVLYGSMPLFWVGGVGYTFMAAMMVGATVVYEDRFEPEATLRLLERERVTQILGWPHLAKALAEHPTCGERDLSALRSPVLDGANQPAGLATSTLGSLGMTETFGPHTYGARPEDPADIPGSFGRPVPGVEHKIIDAITGEDLPAGSSGEICVRGYSLMLGFYKVERSQVFTADGWYRTGDAGWFDEHGHLHFVGRLGDAIKTSGMNVTPRDVEIALEELPEVVAAFVTGTPSERGEDVVAGVVIRPGANVDAASLRAAVKDRIASYKVPRHITLFTSQAELPMLDSGKIDRRRVNEAIRTDYEPHPHGGA